MSETRCPNKVHGPDYVLWMEEDESDSKENGEDVTDNVYSWGGFREDLDLCETHSK